MYSSRSRLEVGRTKLRFRFSSRKVIRNIILCLVLFAILPPIFFHFRLSRFHQMQVRKCGWLNDPPLVCAHGGDSSKASPNTMAAYLSALHSQVDCIEIDVSRSLDGVLFALHDRDLQRLSGNATSKVGHMSSKEIRELGATRHSVEKLNDESIPTIQDALLLTSNSVQQIVLDVKVGPPFFEKGLAEDVLSIVEKTECRNCVIWAKSDDLAREVIKISSEITVGYIVMREPKTGARTNLLRMKGAEVVGVYHPLIDEKLMKILHRRNKKVYAWTVDDEESMQKMLFEHVDAIVTGNPTLLQLLMQDTRTQCLEEGYSLSN
ncbi:putative glycerophosphodiester phosphodiesterase [Lupinus albus]|uniref:glycerophosphodiester phosphodiesterase n=1 Tax=Lupinus albus TaxID=3870 RepID=A0A6A4P6F4_LUPAL|nr:putative glycerophosphodiester phosphodiesterase [Lupinus albus]